MAKLQKKPTSKPTTKGSVKRRPTPREKFNKKPHSNPSPRLINLNDKLNDVKR